MVEPSATATVTIDAPAREVYQLVSDLPGMAKLAEEYVGGDWLDEVSEPAPGARFRGRNRQGRQSWSTVATVTDAQRERRFAFDVRSFGLPVARWQYDIEPTDDGCVVTESTWDRRPIWFRPLARVATGVPDRARHNQRNIELTLARLKAAAEAR